MSTAYGQEVSEIDGLRSRDRMLGDVQKYLITGAEMRREIRRKSWMCFGTCHLANDSRSTVYWYLAFTVFVLMGLVYAWTEDFPSGVKN